MKKLVYDYIKEYNHVSIHDIASEIKKEEIEILKTVLILEKEGYIKMDTPVPLSIDNDESCYYSITNKKYE